VTLSFRQGVDGYSGTIDAEVWTIVSRIDVQ